MYEQYEHMGNIYSEGEVFAEVTVIGEQDSLNKIIYEQELNEFEWFCVITIIVFIAIILAWLTRF